MPGGGGFKSGRRAKSKGFQVCAVVLTRLRGTETSGRGDEGGFWTVEGADRGGGGEVGGGVGWFLPLSFFAPFPS